MGSEITSGPWLVAPYTAESPRNQLQHAPKKPKSLPCDSVNVVTCVESERDVAGQLIGLRLQPGLRWPAVAWGVIGADRSLRSASWPQAAPA